MRVFTYFHFRDYCCDVQAELAYSFVVGSTRVLVFDRWQHAPDHLKGHDPEIWMPVQFTADGGLQRLEAIDAWELDVPTLAMSAAANS
jgi:hypothetical protein